MMAHPKRVAIIELLSEAEHNVGELTKKLNSSISTVSQHLRIMKDKGVVTNRKDAQTVYYRLKNPRLIEGCHIMRDILLEEMESQEQTACDCDEKILLTH